MKRRALFATLTLGALSSFATLAPTAFAQTPIKFALDWRFEGRRRPILWRSTRATTRPKGWT